MAPVLKGKSIGSEQKNSSKRRAPDLENQDLLYCYASHFILFMCNFRIIVFLILC
jgi:hypothetical protein